MGNAIRESSITTTVGKKFQIGNAFFNEKRTILVCVCGRYQTCWAKKQNIDQMWKILMKDVDLGEPTSFLDMYIWVALKDSVKSVTILWRTTEICSNPGFLLEQGKTSCFRDIGCEYFLMVSGGHELCGERSGNDGTEDQGVREAREHRHSGVPQGWHRDSPDGRGTDENAPQVDDVP